MAPSSGKLEGVGGEEQHLDEAGSGVVYWNGEIDLEWQWKTDSRQVRVDCEPFHREIKRKKSVAEKIDWISDFRVESFAVRRAQSQKILETQKMRNL
jgi:hypothetical protein